MSVVVSIEDLSASRKKLRIEVPTPALEAEIQRVTAEFRKRARLPGFRRGKVPLDLVRKRYADEIRQDVIERLIPRYWLQAKAEKELDPLLSPRVSDVDLVDGEGLSFTAVVDVRPEIVLGDLESFELPDPAVEPTAEEIDEALEDLRRQVADWVAAERPAARGDRVRGSLVAVSAAAAEGEEGEAPQPQPVAIEVGAEDVWEELTLAATGLEAGRSTEFGRREPSAEGGLAAERRFRLEVEAVEERDLPPLDDAFAAKLGEFDDLAALRADLERRLGSAKRRERRRARERALLDQLRERHPLALPEGVVEEEVEGMLREYAENLAMRGIDPERAGLDWQAMAGQVRPQAEKRVHARLVLDAIVDEQGIELDSSELEANLARVARAQGRSTPALRKVLDDAGTLEDFRKRLTREKAILRLMNEDAEEADLIGISEADDG